MIPHWSLTIPMQFLLFARPHVFLLRLLLYLLLLIFFLIILFLLRLLLLHFLLLLLLSLLPLLILSLLLSPLYLSFGTTTRSDAVEMCYIRSSMNKCVGNKTHSRRS